MGQWGAFGYADRFHFTYEQILDHYYGGTTEAEISGSPIGANSTVSVAILENVNAQGTTGYDPVVTSPSSFTIVNGTPNPPQTTSTTTTSTSTTTSLPAASSTTTTTAPRDLDELRRRQPFPARQRRFLRLRRFRPDQCHHHRWHGGRPPPHAERHVERIRGCVLHRRVGERRRARLQSRQDSWIPPSSPNARARTLLLRLCSPCVDTTGLTRPCAATSRRTTASDTKGR